MAFVDDDDVRLRQAWPACHRLVGAGNYFVIVSKVIAEAGRQDTMDAEACACLHEQTSPWCDDKNLFAVKAIHDLRDDDAFARTGWHYQQARLTRLDSRDRCFHGTVLVRTQSIALLLRDGFGGHRSDEALDGSDHKWLGRARFVRNDGQDTCFRQGPERPGSQALTSLPIKLGLEKLG